MSKETKTFRPKPRLPKGLRDESGAQIFDQRQMIEVIQAVYERYGFDPLETPRWNMLMLLASFYLMIIVPTRAFLAFRMTTINGSLCGTI